MHKLNKFKVLLIIVISIITIKLLTKNLALVYFQNGKCQVISLLKTSSSGCYSSGFYISNNNNMFKTSWNIFYSFLQVKKWILNTLSLNKVVDQFTLTVLLNEKALSLSTLNTFKYTGIYHLIVISGMHIAILIGILKKLLQVLKVPENIARKILLIVCVFYLLLIKISFPVLYQVLKLEISNYEYNNFIKIAINSILMLVVNFDNVNILSYLLTVMIQVLLSVYKCNSFIAILNIQIMVNIFLFKYTSYYNVFTMVLSPLLIWLFEKILFNFTILYFIGLRTLLYKFIDNLFANYMWLCNFFNKEFNLFIYDYKFCVVLLVVFFISSYWYFNYYENRFFTSRT